MKKLRGNWGVNLFYGATNKVGKKTYRGRVPLTLCRITPEGREAFAAYRRQLKEFIEGS